MKKVRMIVEMDEELYKAFAEQDVFISGMRTGKTLLSEIWKALKNATIVRMSEEKIKESCSLSLVYNEGFDKGYEKARAEYEPEECDDCVSRQAVINFLTEKLNFNEDRRSSENYTGHWVEEEMYSYAVDILENFDEYIRALPPVTPKREQGEWICDDFIESIYHCSLCQGKIKGKLSKYCPNCGAEMAERGEE